MGEPLLALMDKLEWSETYIARTSLPSKAGTESWGKPPPITLSRGVSRVYDYTHNARRATPTMLTSKLTWVSTRRASKAEFAG